MQGLKLTYCPKQEVSEQNTGHFLPTLGENDGKPEKFLDYFTFGSAMPGRSWTADSTDEYRFGFNGMEGDGEVKGEGNHYTTHFRQYDPRVGRWWSLDPKADRFPSASPYAFSFNNPIRLSDPRGDCPEGMDCGDPFENPEIRPTDGSGKEGGRYGYTRSGGTEFHGGLDIRENTGTEIQSISSGEVYARHHNDDLGNYAIVKTDLPEEAEGEVLYTLYAHLESESNATGVVDKGETVGTVGRTGNAENIPEDQIHVHMITKVGEQGDSYSDAERKDPENYLNTKFNEDGKPRHAIPDNTIQNENEDIELNASQSSSVTSESSVSD